MATLNWGLIQDGGTFESLMHAILYTEDQNIILFGRPGKDAGQDARSADGSVVYQAKYRQQLSMDLAIKVALEELEIIKEYRQPTHANNVHWQNARRWVLVANILANPNDDGEWKKAVVPAFAKEGLVADYWGIKILEGRLAENAHIREVFFEGENRILVSLKEAYDRLSNECIGSASLDNPMVGREKEIQAVKEFVAKDGKRILPIVGAAGMGKSRLMYEAMTLLAQDGWRVLWALPEAMARSSRWFHLLNSNQPTCVAVDDPADANLLKAIIEQLVPVERRKWKVIVGCRSSKAELLRPYNNRPELAEPVKLSPLDEPLSKELLKANFKIHIPEVHFHTIYAHTGGVPGWLCLVAELGNRDMLKELPQTVDDIASLYVEDCLNRLSEADTNKGQLLLRYLALWGTISLNPNDDSHPQAEFLSTQGLPLTDLQRLLELFVNGGIVRNWGVGKRLFAIQPMIVREYVLSSWLFTENGDKYCVTSEGRRIIDLLVHGTIPFVELALRSISHLTRSRLDVSQGYSFVKPVFEELLRIARNGTVIEQSRLLTLIEVLGPSDPESALDVIKAIRENPQSPVEVQDVFWGKATVTHTSVMAKLSWLLFTTAAYVQDESVALRYLEEFRQHLTLEEVLKGEIEDAKMPRKLLERLLCESKNAYLFAGPAGKIVSQEVELPDSWPFAGVLLECLLNPEREYTEWTAQWTLTFTRRSFIPDSQEWILAEELRKRAFQMLRSQKDRALRAKVWRILSETHQQFHRLLLHDRVSGNIAEMYHILLLNDLATAATILETPPIELAVEEIVAARAMWAWYLKYGNSENVVALARRCEAACSTTTKWQPQAFFRFDTDEELAPETNRVASQFKNATDTSAFADFFAESKAYLDAARAGGQDMADSSRIMTLADAVADVFMPFNNDSAPLLTAYVAQVLKQSAPANELAWLFAVRICQKYILRTKKAGGERHIATELKELLSPCHDKARFLFDIYSNPHPLNTGELQRAEFDVIFANEHKFTNKQRFVLLGVFAPTFWVEAEQHLNHYRGNLNGQTEELSNCVTLFIRMLHLTALRYQLAGLGLQLEWIMETIVQHDLDGRILGGYEFKWLREKSSFHLQLEKLVKLIDGRIQSEHKPHTNHSYQILPFDFRISDWCRFDLSNVADATAFEDFCALSLGHSYVAMHRMPKFIAEIDTEGLYVARFVEKMLKESPPTSVDSLARLAFIASGYADSTPAWARVARPICESAMKLTRNERDRVFMGLSRKETGVLSGAPGEVNQYYFRMRDIATRMRDAEAPDSPLQSYREWAVRRAESELQFEQQRSEEVGNE